MKALPSRKQRAKAAEMGWGEIQGREAEWDGVRKTGFMKVEVANRHIKQRYSFPKVGFENGWVSGKSSIFHRENLISGEQQKMSFLLFLRNHSEAEFPFFLFFQITVFLTIFVLKAVLISLFVGLAESRILLNNFLENVFLCLCVHGFSTLNTLPDFLDVLNQCVLPTP